MPKHRTFNGCQNTDRRGAAMIDFAVCLPMLVLLVFGAIESSSQIFLKQTIGIAAYETAREIIRENSSIEEASKRGDAVLLSRLVKGAEITFTPEDTNVPRGTEIAVAVTAPTQSNSPILGRFVANRVLTSKVVMLKE